MASKVNTKFVVMLVGALLALAIGVGALAAYSLRMSGERNIAAGDELMVQADQARAAGDEEQALEYINEAAGQYGRAVHKDRSRRDWLVKLRDTLLLTNPDSEVEYQKRYRQSYLGVLEQIASLDPTNGYAQHAFVEAREEWLRLIGGAEALLQIESEIERRVQSLDEDSPMAIRLNAILGLARVDRAGLDSVDAEKRDEASALMRRFYEAFLADPQLFSAAPPEASPDEFADAAREDHRRIALGLIRTEIVEYQIAQNEGRSQDARQSLVDASAIGEAILAENPEYRSDADFQNLITTTALVLVSIDEPNPVRQREVTKQILADAKDRLFASLAEADAEDVSLRSIVQFGRWYTDDESRDQLIREVERVLAAGTASPSRLLSAAEVLAELGRREDALAIFERIETMPTPTLSLEGVVLPNRQNAAMAAQARIYLDLRQRALAAGNAAEAKAHLDAAIEARNRLAENTGMANRQNLLLTDAKLAIAQNQVKQAIRLLEEYRKEFDESSEMLAELAGLFMAEGNLGEAQQILERLAASGTLAPGGALRLAEIYASNGDMQRALDMLQNQARTSPNPEEYADAIANIKQLMDIRAGNDTSDPVRAALVRAQDLLARRDIDGATQILDRLVARQPEAVNDPGVAILTAQIESFRGNKDAAVARLERALEANPGNEVIQRLLTAYTTDNPVELRLSEIDASDASDAQKALRRFEVLNSAGRGDEAMLELDRLEQLDPAHPTVLDVRFAEALEDDDFAAAERVVARAEEANADGVDGLLYQGRLQAARGERDAAVRTLRTAVELVPSSIEIRRYLGQVLVDVGQIDEGLEYLRRAYEARKDNLVILSEYVQVLRQVGRVSEARAVLDPGDDSGAPARQSRFFTNIWLTLEAQAGNSAKAIQERQTYFRADLMSGELETDSFASANAIALMELLVSDNQIDEAERVLAQSRDVLNDQQAALADAGIAVGRAKALEDEEESRRAIGDAVAGFRETAQREATRTGSADPLLQAARLAFNIGEFEQGIDILRSAVPFETDATREVSREIATRLAGRASQLDTEARSLNGQAQQAEASDRLVAEGLRERAAQSRGRAEALREEAVEVYAQLLSTMTEDEGSTIALSLAELLLQTEELDRASTIVSRVRDDDPSNLRATLLAAQIASRKGDRTEATRLFNQAVESNPTNFLPFFERARFFSDDTSRRSDVLADLRRVNQLRPSLAEGWLLRYQVMMQSGDADAAFTVLRDGISTAPSIAEALSRQLVNELLRAGRAAEARSFASQRADEIPDSTYWQNTAGELAKRQGSMNEAVRYFTMLFENPEVVADASLHGQAAAVLLDAKLRAGQSVPASEIAELLPLIEELGMEGSAGVTRAMLLARAFAAIPAERNRASGYIQRAYLEAVREDGDISPTQKLRVWYEDLPLIVGGKQQALDYVAGLERSIRNQMQQDPQADITNPLFLRVLALQASQVRGESPSDLIERAKTLLAESENDPIARFEINKLLSTLSHRVDDHESAASYGKDALAMNANDLELLNNVAFFLAKYLDRPTEALPFAERAAQLGPENPDVLDTVGVVYMLSGEADRAITLFERALQFAATQEQRVPTSIHLAEALLKQGDREAARGYIEDAERLLPVVAEGVRSTYAPELERVKGLLESR